MGLLELQGLYHKLMNVGEICCNLGRDAAEENIESQEHLISKFVQN